MVDKTDIRYRAQAAYARACRVHSTVFDAASDDLHTAGGKDYVVLYNVRGILMAFVETPTGRVRRVKVESLPKSITRHYE